MTLSYIGFFILAAITLSSAILAITRRNAVHSAIFLIITLLSVGGLYLLMQAEFLFAVQVILYVGGIMVLFLFVIMLVKVEEAQHQAQFNRQWWVALLVVAVLGIELGYVLYRGHDAFVIDTTQNIVSDGTGSAAASAPQEGNIPADWYCPVPELHAPF